MFSAPAGQNEPLINKTLDCAAPTIIATWREEKSSASAIYNLPALKQLCKTLVYTNSTSAIALINIPVKIKIIHIIYLHREVELVNAALNKYVSLQYTSNTHTNSCVKNTMIKCKRLESLKLFCDNFDSCSFVL